ncbi:Uncharacterised protein [Haemophilus parahaemolyticus]|uniref:Uncharacterized protein n=1 Tax=Haemophilus parahaemolyticus TaxID=735 RepID=A0A377I1M6_HAEPH|nr:hypothetical protein [Haemophilus parahaemolyticus]STO64456.1 Uncharacterised protein [Haemophilus parahaemolyticus]
MKKTFKAITAAATLLASITSNAQDTHINALEQNATKIHQLAKSDAELSQIFIALEKLTSSIDEVSLGIKAKQLHLDKARLKELTIIRHLLDMNSTLLVTKYEQAIRSEYRQTYRQYASSIRQLDDAMLPAKEKFGLLNVAHIEGLDVSEQELAEINLAAEKRG